MSIATALCLSATLLLLRPPALWLVCCRLGSPRTRTVDMRHILGRIGAPALFLVPVFLVITFAHALAHVIVGLTVIGIAAAVARMRLRAQRDRQRRVRSADVAEAIDALAAELGAGVLPTRALQHLAEDLPMLEPAATAARLGGDVAAALRTSAAAAGAERLDDLAAAWDVSRRSGAPMARVLDRLGDGLRDEREVQREIDAGLGPAKATARLMAVLPLLGLGLGSGIGSSPVHILFGTVPGALCLALGAAFACAGLGWVDAIAARAAQA